jgi:hypothetical protein
LLNATAAAFRNKKKERAGVVPADVRSESPSTAGQDLLRLEIEHGGDVGRVDAGVARAAVRPGAGAAARAVHAGAPARPACGFFLCVFQTAGVTALKEKDTEARVALGLLSAQGPTRHATPAPECRFSPKVSLMFTARRSPRPDNEFLPHLEPLEDRCTPVASVTQSGNLVTITQDQSAGGTILVQDNGTSNTGAITVFWNGSPVFTLNGAAVNPLQPIQVVINGSSQSDTVVYNLAGNLTTDASQLPPYPKPPANLPNPPPGNASAGRSIQANLGAGNTDQFFFTWPFQGVGAGTPNTGSLAAISGLLDLATFSLLVQSTAKTEFLSANLNIVAFNAGVFVGLFGGGGVDHVVLNENIVDLTGGGNPAFPGTNSPNVRNTTVIGAAGSQKGSQLVDLPRLQSGSDPKGAPLSDPNTATLAGSTNDLATLLLPPVRASGLDFTKVVFLV